MQWFEAMLQEGWAFISLPTAASCGIGTGRIGSIGAIAFVAENIDTTHITNVSRNEAGKIITRCHQARHGTEIVESVREWSSQREILNYQRFN